MKTYAIQIRVCSLFEDVVVAARTEREAVAKAKTLARKLFTAREARWATYAVI